jgi:hypothetical protein
MNRAAAVLLLVASFPAAATRAADDPRAAAVGKAMIDAMGGPSAWDHARYFRFDFTVVRAGKKVAAFSHYWDRWTGRYRVEGEDAHGVPWKAYFNVNTKEGDYWVNGAKTEGDTRAKGIENAYGRFINDSYGTRVPSDRRASGVRRQNDAGGRPCDEIKLFECGPTQGRLLTSTRVSHLMDEWS